MICRLILCSICLFATAAAFAAPPDLSKVPPPREPWVAPVPEKGQWMVRIKDPDAVPKSDAAGNPTMPSGVNRLPVEISSMTWNTVKRDIFRFTDGSQSTLFYYAGFVLVEGKSSKGQPAPVLVQQLPGTDFSTLRSGGWLGMDWLEKQYFVKAVEYLPSHLPEGSKSEICYYYRKPEGNAPGSENWLPELKAWVRVEDLQPVAFALGPRLFEFQRMEAPVGAPQMTQEQAAKLLDLKDQNERMERLRERNRRLRGE